MGANRQIDLAAFDRSVNLSFACGRERACQQLYSIRCLREHALYVCRMLLSKYFRWNHNSSLIAVLNRDYRGLNGHYRLAAAHVALKQAIHRRRTGHVFDDFPEHSLLRAGRFERQHRANGFTHAIVDFDDCSLGRLLAALPAQTHCECEPEELFEDQSPMRGRSESVVRFKRRVIGRKMNVSQRRRFSNDSLPRQNIFRKHLLDFREVESVDDVMHDRAKLLGATLSQLPINRHSPACVDWVCVIDRLNFSEIEEV